MTEILAIVIQHYELPCQTFTYLKQVCRRLYDVCVSVETLRTNAKIAAVIAEHRLPKEMILDGIVVGNFDCPYAPIHIVTNKPMPKHYNVQISEYYNRFRFDKSEKIEGEDGLYIKIDRSYTANYKEYDYNIGVGGIKLKSKLVSTMEPRCYIKQKLDKHYHIAHNGRIYSRNWKEKLTFTLALANDLDFNYFGYVITSSMDYVEWIDTSELGRLTLPPKDHRYYMLVKMLRAIRDMSGQDMAKIMKKFVAE